MILQLPVEILVSIFGYLPLSDRQACRLTCKHLNEVGLTYSLIKNETILIDSRYFKSPINIACWKETDRLIYRAVIKDLDNFHVLWFFQKYGITLKTLTLNRLTIDVDDFTRVLKLLRNIDNLYILNCDQILIEGTDFSSICSDANPSLKNLKELEISNTKYLTDNSLNGLISLFPNITHLSLKNTSICCHAGVNSFYYKNKSDVIIRPSRNVLTVKFLIAIIETKCKNMESINLSRTIINNQALNDLLKIDNLKLCRLNISYCHELRENDMVALGNWQPTLTELHITACDMVTNNFLEHISEKLINLKILSISYSSNIDDMGLVLLQKLEKLIELDISNCENISSFGIRTLLSSDSVCKTIKILEMTNTAIEDCDLAYICLKLNLTELNVSYCKKLSDECLNNLFEHQIMLTKLGIAGLNISDEGCTGIDGTAPPMHGLFEDVREEGGYGDWADYFEDVEPLSASLENLKCLVSLDLSKSELVTDFTFVNVRTLRNLRELSLAGLHHVSNYSISYLTLASPGIEIINVSGCNIDDFGVQLMIKNLKRLKNLDIRNNLRITDDSLLWMIIYCSTLQELNVMGCFGLSRRRIRDLEDMPNIQRVHSSFPQSYPMAQHYIPRAPAFPPNV